MCIEAGYSDSSYQETMEAQHGHAGDVMTEPTIPKERVAAALRRIEEVGTNLLPQDSINAYRIAKLFQAIYEARRALGIEEEA